MDMQLFWDVVATVINVSINVGIWVALGLFIRYMIIKSKRQ